MTAKSYLKLLVVTIVLSTIFSSVYFVNRASATTVFTSYITFNNTKDATGKVLSNLSFKLINVTGNTVQGPFTCNSTGGIILGGIANGTVYHIDFYWMGFKVYQTPDFTTSATAGANNTVGPYTCSRLASNVDGSSVSALIQNATGVSFVNVTFSDKTLRATLEATGVSILIVSHGTDLLPPVKVFVGGQDITAYKVTSIDLLGNYSKAWYYDSANRLAYIKGTHSSPLTYEVQFEPSGYIPPQQPWSWTITIFDQRIPVLLLACAILLLIALIGGAYLIIAGRS
jgi:hypothetical protein